MKKSGCVGMKAKQTVGKGSRPATGQKIANNHVEQAETVKGTGTRITGRKK